MESSEVTNQLLKKKYDLHKSPEVENAAKRTRMRTGEKVPQDPLAQIQNYLDRFHEITDRTDPEKRERGIQAIKTVLLDKFVTKFEDIPESYWKSQEGILRERGQQGDYNRFSKEEKNKWKKEVSEGVLKDQRASLEQWIDYLASEDSSYMPDAMKYWVFRNVVSMQEYDKEKQEFPQRSKGAIKMFPDINHEALSYVIDAVAKKYKGETLNFKQFTFDLTDEQKKQFQQALARENFPALYGWANEQITPIPKHLLPVTQGAWVKYNQNSDHLPLVKSVRGYGTGWCIAGDSVAKNYLAQGDFYLFYSNDDKKNPSIPRIAIRIEGGKIAEVRGIAYKQNLDSYVSDVLKKKLDEFPDRDQYLKKESDMKCLTAIEHQIKEGQSLTLQDLRFLYELDASIEGFGNEKDPRIKELREQRNSDEDMPVVFECDKSQIARGVGEINKDTKVYVGVLTPGIFDAIQRYNIEHVYTTFPEGRIRRESIEIGGKSVRELEQELKQANINVSEYAKKDMLYSKDFITLPNSQTLDTVRLKVGDLLPGNPTTDQIYAKAKELGLELVPAETGVHYRLKYKDQPLDEWLYMGMKQIPDRSGYPHVFKLYRDDGGLWLDYGWAGPDGRWYPEGELMFFLSKSEPQKPGFLSRFLKH